MSIALWPVFEDRQEHGLVDEGAILLDVSDELDAIAQSAGRAPLTAFDAYIDVPEDVLEQRAMEADGLPDLSDLPATWHDPADAVSTLDALVSGVGSGSWDSEYDREHVVGCLEAFRAVLRGAAERGTRFHLTVA